MVYSAMLLALFGWTNRAARDDGCGSAPFVLPGAAFDGAALIFLVALLVAARTFFGKRAPVGAA